MLNKLSYTKIQKLILQNHIFKYVNIDKLLEYNIFVNGSMGNFGNFLLYFDNI